MSTLNESQKRRYVATQAMACGCHGVSKVSKFFGVNQKTVYAGIKECEDGYTYPTAGTKVLLCDGGGSNSSSHKIVKQDFMDLANRLGMNIMVIHYPPYCSKFNPIEHRLFSQITRSWNGAPLTSVENAAQRAELTTTATGLKVHVHIDNKTYETGRKINADYFHRRANQIVFREILPKWNYLIKPA